MSSIEGAFLALTGFLKCPMRSADNDLEGEIRFPFSFMLPRRIVTRGLLGEWRCADADYVARGAHFYERSAQEVARYDMEGGESDAFGKDSAAWGAVLTSWALSKAERQTLKERNKHEILRCACKRRGGAKVNTCAVAAKCRTSGIQQSVWIQSCVLYSDCCKILVNFMGEPLE